jgi:Resolvase, N terminal domain
VTQQFNTTTSMGRLTLNVLLSFAQFEREVIGERIRDCDPAWKIDPSVECAPKTGQIMA